MSRIKFPKGKQKEFITKVLEKTNCPSVRELRKRGFDVSYSALKNYFSERRNLPSDLYEQLLNFSGLNKKDFNCKILEDNYGQVKGGKKRRT
ncbi:MAG: hypothetical protein WC309_04055 [Candidatus Paceibacterota bacterium]|jgi:hypothetical protein